MASNGNDSPIMFKTAVGGFEKKAVINYIFELNESAQEAQRKLTEQLEEADHAREALDQQLNEANKKVQRLQEDTASLTDQLNGERKRNNEMAEDLGKLNAEVERQRAVVAKREEELQKAVLIKERVADIEAAAGKYAEEIKTLRAQAAEKDGQLKNLREQIAKKEAAPAQQKPSGREVEQEQIITQLKAEVQRLRTAAQKVAATPEAGKQIADLRATVEGLNKELRVQRDRAAQIEAEAKDGGKIRQEYKAKLEELERKQKEIDRSSAQVGRLLLDATADADRIRTDAGEEGERIVFRAKDEAEKIVRAAGEKAKEITEDAGRTLAEVRGRIATFRTEMAGLQDHVCKAAAEMQEKAKSVGRYIENVEQKREDPPAQRTKEKEKKADGGIFFRNAAER